jgi:hypothetical protein
MAHQKVFGILSKSGLSASFSAKKAKDEKMRTPMAKNMTKRPNSL